MSQIGRYVVIFRSDTERMALVDWLETVAPEGYVLVVTKRGSRTTGNRRTVRLANGTDMETQDTETGTEFIFERRS